MIYLALLLAFGIGWYISDFKNSTIIDRQNRQIAKYKKSIYGHTYWRD